MKHGAVRKLMRAAILSLLALGMTSGVASAAVWAATSPATTQADEQGGASAGSDPATQGGGSTQQPGDKKPDPTGGALGGGLPLVGGALGGTLGSVG